MIVFSYAVFVNNDSTSYDTSSSLRCKDGIENNMLGKIYISLMEYLFLHKGFK